jgi:NADH-quinone oxidoreductase subunit B
MALTDPVPVYQDPDTTVACRNVDRDERSLLRKVLDKIADHCRARSLFVLHYCTGCGAIELPPSMTSRFDLERLGIQPMVTPRQADILLITGYLSVKTLKRVILTYEQMQSPEYVVGLGSCSINGGMYWHSYATIKQLGQYIPADIYALRHAGFRDPGPAYGAAGEVRDLSSRTGRAA